MVAMLNTLDQTTASDLKLAMRIAENLDLTQSK